MLISNLKDTVKIKFEDLAKGLNAEQKKNLRDFYEISEDNTILTFETSVGGVVFDIYSSVVEMPKAPYNREKEKMKRQKLAESFAHETVLNLPSEVTEAVAKALKTDEIWSKVVLGVKLVDQDKTDVFQSSGIDLFPNIRDEVLKLCD